jgi:DNA-binding MarR family transcriptional regulator
MSTPKIRDVEKALARDAELMQEAYSTGVLVALLVNEELEAVGVPHQDFSFLGWVYSLQPVTPGRLSAETGLPPTTIRDYIRRLVLRGDVRKVRNPDDGRSYHMMLTPKGRRLMDRGWPAVVAAFARVVPHLDRPAAEYVVSVRELRDALRKAVAGPSSTS